MIWRGKGMMSKNGFAQGRRALNTCNLAVGDVDLCEFSGTRVTRRSVWRLWRSGLVAASGKRRQHPH
jgi:hypothetical protein